MLFFAASLQFFKCCKFGQSLLKIILENRKHMTNTKGSVDTTFLKKTLPHIFNEVEGNSIQNQLWHRVIPVKRDVIIVKREGFYLCYVIFYI